MPFLLKRKKLLMNHIQEILLDYMILEILKLAIHLTEGEILNFKGIPSFSPEHFRYVNNADPLKSKQLDKGLIN